jgi:hypothetical protein
MCRRVWILSGKLFFRPFGAESFLNLTHGLRRGLYYSAASRLGELANNYCITNSCRFACATAFSEYGNLNVDPSYHAFH